MSRQLCEILLTAQDPLSKTQSRATQASLFLGSGEAYSRVDAYATELLHSRAGECTSLHESTRTQTSPFATDGELQDNFSVTEMTSLRSPEQLTEYQRLTKGFRAYFIWQRISYGPLLVTANLFDQLLSIESIPAQLRDYIIFYGRRVREVEVVPPILKFRPLLWSQTNGQSAGHECMYGMRFFELNGRGSVQEPSTQWSLRQSIVYSRSCSDMETTTWLFVTISPIVQKRLDAYVTGSERADLANPFEIHLIILQTIISNWRFFLIALSTEIDEEATQIAGTSFNNAGPVNLFDSNRRQHLVYLEETVSRAVAVAKATSATVEALSFHHYNDATEYYGSSSAAPAIIEAGLIEQNRTLSSTIACLDTMRAKIQASSVLLSSLLDQSSGHALETLGQESRAESMEMRVLSERMHKLTEKATQDAAAVKVLTIMTLIYLPATVVSNFFSTSFVVTESSSNGGSGHISVLGDWWIFVVVTLPLTAITLYVWWTWSRIKTHGKYPWWLRTRRAKPSHKKPPLDHDLERGSEKAPGTSSSHPHTTVLGFEHVQRSAKERSVQLACGGVNTSWS
jgi:hypothetical protein